MSSDIDTDVPFRTSPSDPIAPYLPNIENKLTRFYADSANRIELIGTLGYRNHLERTVFQRLLVAGERYVLPETRRRISMIQDALQPPDPHYPTFVAFHWEHVIGANSFQVDSENRRIIGQQLGATDEQPGTGTALVHAIAAFGAEHGYEFQTSCFHKAITFHARIGRIINPEDITEATNFGWKGFKPYWTKEDMETIATLRRTI